MPNIQQFIFHLKNVLKGRTLPALNRWFPWSLNLRRRSPTRRPHHQHDEGCRLHPNSPSTTAAFQTAPSNSKASNLLSDDDSGGDDGVRFAPSVSRTASRQRACCAISLHVYDVEKEKISVMYPEEAEGQTSSARAGYHYGLLSGWMPLTVTTSFGNTPAPSCCSRCRQRRRTYDHGFV